MPAIPRRRPRLRWNRLTDLERRLDDRFKHELEKHNVPGAELALRRADRIRAAMMTSAPSEIRSYTDFD
jgi:hypothetical protein